MKLALVFDAPRSNGSPLGGQSGEYLKRTIAACAASLGVEEPEFASFYAVPEAQPGGKAPAIAVVRENRDQLFEALEAWQPDRVLSLGASALNALSVDATKVLAISKERGRGRMLGDCFWVPTITPVAVIKSADLHRDLANDVYKVLAQDAPLPPMQIDLRVPDTLDELRLALAELEGASVVGVDVETTGLSPYRDALLAVGIGAVYDDTSGIAVVVKKALLEQPAQAVADELWDAVWRKSRRSVGHNFKFDMQFLWPVVGWPPDPASTGDTLLLSHLLDERPNRPTSRVRGLGLKDQVATRYDHQYGFDFGEFYDAPDDAKDWDAMHAYLGEDVVYTARLWLDLEREARAESPALMKAHDGLITAASRSIARCELTGAPLDVAWVEETVRLLDARIARRRAALEAYLPRIAKTAVENVLAPGQVADVMYDEWGMTPDIRKHGRAKVGDRSTDRDHIKAAVAKYLGTELDAPARWLRTLDNLRRDVKSRATFQKSYLDKVDDDSRIRAGFLLHGTSTGRLSSAGPNLQNVAAVNRDDSILWRPQREAFRAPPGRFWVEVDYSQLELRVAAALSQDPDFIRVFSEGHDVHMEIATQIFSKPADEISKGERFLAKAVSFGIIYGRTGRALAAGAEMRYAEQKLGMTPWTEDQANAFIKKFLRSYPRLKAWMDELYDRVPKQGFVETPYGRRRRFPLYPKSRGELGAIQRQAVNTPVQSVASDICLEAMTRVMRGIDWFGIDAQVLFPVHDSICIEVAEAEVDTLERLCRSEMERDYSGVPLRVDYEYGPTWATVKEHKEA